eukprot:scaffold2343_cov173-Pinguiococcus_pyrenoidosus.AAC.2
MAWKCLCLVMQLMLTRKSCSCDETARPRGLRTALAWVSLDLSRTTQLRSSFPRRCAQKPNASPQDSKESLRTYAGLLRKRRKRGAAPARTLMERDGFDQQEASCPRFAHSILYTRA